MDFNVVCGTIRKNIKLSFEKSLNYHELMLRYDTVLRTMFRAIRSKEKTNLLKDPSQTNWYDIKAQDVDIADVPGRKSLRT